MEQLNNKGITIIEILLCFIIVSVIAISLFNLIMDYKSDEQTENIRNTVLSYKNSITRVVQDDIIKNKLTSYTITNNTSGSNNIWTIVLNFKIPFQSTTSNIYSKTMTINISKNNNYIIYPDIIVDGANLITQNVKYSLYKTTDVYDYDKGSKTTFNDIRFLPPDDSYLVPNEYVFSFKLPIYHSELNNNYYINFTAPLVK